MSFTQMASSVLRSTRVVALLIGGAAAGLSCEDSIVPTSDEVDPLDLVISPASTAICEGHLETLTAQLIGDSTQTERAVLFTARDSTIVGIREQDGQQALLEGLRTGATSVIVTAVADASVADSARVDVGFCTSPTPTVAFAGITVSGTTTPVEPDNVAGMVDVHLNVDALPDDVVARLVVAGLTTVECEPIPPSATATHCILDTRAIDANGVRVIPDGAHDVSARIVRPGGTIIAITRRTWVFNNM